MTVYLLRRYADIYAVSLYRLSCAKGVLKPHLHNCMTWLNDEWPAVYGPCIVIHGRSRLLISVLKGSHHEALLK